MWKYKYKKIYKTQKQVLKYVSNIKTKYLELKENKHKRLSKSAFYLIFFKSPHLSHLLWLIFYFFRYFVLNCD